MKIKVTQDDIAKGINKVITSVNPRSTLPILSNILLETVGKDQLKIIGTDLEIGIINTIPAEVIEAGTITIPAKKINDIVREAPEDDIEISVNKNNSINIKSGKAFFKLMGLPRDDYPTFPQYSLESAMAIDQNILKECITLTAFAISSDETRYVLNGALVIIKNKTIKMIATDGRRLAVIEKGINVTKDVNVEVIVPTKAFYELNKNIQTEGVVHVVELGNQIIFAVENVTIISRLIEGHFPNYEQVIPAEEKVIAKINREKLLSTLRRVSLLTSLEAQAVKVDLLKGNKMIISARSPNIGESKEEIEVALEKGEEITIGFNPAYLIDVLKNLDIEEIIFALMSEDKPGIIRGKEGYIYVIMPMQIG